ncbi:MAG: tripartite tricarboxylate transporter substrate binding protein [Betaproteobacteria bacterium]|nr:tripartite tricarboxylate transporter substrate binding protein [Betaproteobacteria bacterium]
MNAVSSALVAALLTAGATTGAAADNWPSRPVTMVLPFGAGGATDAIGRVVGERMSKGLDQPVVISNRAGAGGEIAATSVAKSPADGYTILFATVSTLVVLPLTKPSLGYNVAKDFVPIGLVAKSPNLLLVSPRLPVNSLQELIAYAKQNPGKLNFASSGTGTNTHLIGEAFKFQAGIEAIHVPYRTGVQAFAELTEGQIHFSFDTIVWSLPQVQAGKLKSFGITSAQRSKIAPEIPTIAEQGLPGFEGITWYAVMTPVGTPEPVLATLRKELAAALNDPAVVERVRGFGAEAAFGGPDEYATLIKQETAKWGRIVKQANIKVR